mmetsp:Transcript_10905/g.16842  ORF Transcript_10905/g.16842 Transcript_10905/m.16842 type:complete len:399 (+) Transcript_10905:149-1345(+)|eukprot:CAMPEP_0195288776 /NCGR_PEP_ID=MMETSP0707-20130614/5302_1 /TAXON_ID=33640 /ORGANISM="Asterionellopsis glacialis, Strain CCMP134" /LENGTH=398 /DNA_ID=CAMNT_0040348679 /DNA_START=127 /DNA_END=1323 /DNA_ORIENTATION=-
MILRHSLLLAVVIAPVTVAFVVPQASSSASSSSLWKQNKAFVSSPNFMSTSPIEAAIGQPSELPDSLDDAAEIAASNTAAFAEASGPMSRCRVDFDTSAGDETFTALKSSTEFMQKYVTALSYSIVPGLQARRQDEMMRFAQAKSELMNMGLQNVNEDDDDDEGSSSEQLSDDIKAKRDSLLQILNDGGRDPENKEWKGPKVRIYFPDEGSAALARRDWKIDAPPGDALVPPCVEFSSCGGIQYQDISNDMAILFFCPRASEAESVEEILIKSEETLMDNLAVTVFVNPVLVDMGITGFGLSGRMLRERLIDGLVNTYYLRTLAWGALTRRWPSAFSVWQEDENVEGGYRLIRAQDTLPSNPEVEDIYDMENGDKDRPSEGPGVLNALGDFVNGMMRL